VEIRERIAVILCLGIGLASSGLTVAQSSAGLGQEMSHADREPPGLHDFDFLFGRWQVHHRKLKHRLVNRSSGRHLPRCSHQIVRRQDEAVVDLVDGQQDATWADGSARERQLPQWRRNVLCERRYRRRETSPHTARMVRDHTHLRSLGAGRINRQW
jgi:hypothetical protein